MARRQVPPAPESRVRNTAPSIIMSVGTFYIACSAVFFLTYCWKTISRNQVCGGGVGNVATKPKGVSGQSINLLK